MSFDSCFLQRTISGHYELDLVRTPCSLEFRVFVLLYSVSGSSPLISQLYHRVLRISHIPFMRVTPQSRLPIV